VTDIQAGMIYGCGGRSAHVPLRDLQQHQGRGNPAFIKPQGSQLVMTTVELSKRTGITVSNINLWVRAGWLRPEFTAYGKGSAHEFSEDNALQAIAIAKIRETFGDGSAARRALAEAIPQVKVGIEWISVREELLLTA
jgi:hypothetical protein